MTRSFIKTVATIVALAAVPAAAQAQFTFNFDGGVALRDPNASATNPTTTGTLILDFTNPTGVGNALGTGSFLVNQFALNTLPGVSGGQIGTIRDLAVTPAGTSNLPVANFIQIGTYSFTLTSTTGTGATLPTSGTPANQSGNFGPIFLSQDAAGVTATFSGQGTVTGGVFGTTPTAFNARFTSQFVNQPGQTPFTIASLAQTIATNPAGLPANGFSATVTTAAVIPEPSTYALMASGVAMLGVFARRRRQQA